MDIIKKVIVEVVNGDAYTVFDDPANISSVIRDIVSPEMLAMPFRIFSIRNGEFIYTIEKI